MNQLEKLWHAQIIMIMAEFLHFFLKKKSNFSFIKLRAGNKYKGPDF